MIYDAKGIRKLQKERQLKQTNFDRIKAMSVEELAKIIQCPKGKNSDYGKRNCKINIPCYLCIKQYLESEVQEDD